MLASDKRQCSSCGKILNVKDKHNLYFGTFKLPIQGTGRHVNLGVHKLGTMEFNVVDWTGLEQPSELWECGSGWCYWSGEIRYRLNDLIEKLK